ncbi:MAG: hypothetical protein ACRC9Q_02445, partial [Bacteroidales bacterium]
MKKTALSLVMLGCFCGSMAKNKAPELELGVSVHLNDSNMPNLFKAANKYGIRQIEIVLPRYDKTNIREYLAAIDKASSLIKKENLKLWSIHIPFSWDYD